MENTNLINRSAVKKLALETAKNSNKESLTRVSAEFVERANAALQAWVTEQIQSHPLEGKTIR